MAGIDTGIIQTQTSGNGTMENDNRFTSAIVYPGSENKLIRVTTGTVAVVTVYGDMSDINTGTLEGSVPLEIKVKKLLRSVGTDDSSLGGHACGIVVNGKKAVIAGEAEICNLKLVKCRPVSVIRIPGIYTIEVPSYTDSGGEDVFVMVGVEYHKVSPDANFACCDDPLPDLLPGLLPIDEPEVIFD